MDSSGLATAAVLGMNASLIPYRGIMPTVHPSVFLAEGARIVGDVVLGRDCSVWFNAVVRGDVHWIRVGERTNIQDGAVLHVTHQRFPLTIGSDVTVGHSAVLHGCTIEDTCLIGMGAVVLDDAVVRRNSLIAAGAVVREGFDVPEGMLAAGVPAVIKRPLTTAEREMVTRSAGNYMEYVRSFRNG